MISKNHLAKFIWIAGLLAVLSACGNNKQPDTIDLSVNISDVSGKPTDGVSITTLNQSDQRVVVDTGGISDESGSALLRNIPENTELVFKFSKTGYASQVKTLSTLTADTAVSLDVVMIQKAAAISFAADQPAALNGKDGASVEVSANAFVDSDGNAVSGDIDVQITPVDVSTAAGLQAFPGSFRGILDDSSFTPYIVSFGTTEYSFSQNGEELQLAPGQTAIIDLPMYIDTYPNGNPVEIGDEIPLWSLNEDTAIWQQEGFGEVIAMPQSKTGLAMRATVGHFTWWNVDWSPDTDTGNGQEESKIVDFDLLVIVVNQNGVRTTQYDGQTTVVDFQTSGYSSSGHGLIGDSERQQVWEGLFCFQAHARISTSGALKTLTSEQVCNNIQGGELIVLRLVDVTFKVTKEVRPTATVGTDFGACGDLPRIDAESGFPLNYEIVGGSLPAGLVLETSGAITGTATSRGQFEAQIEVVENLNGQRGESEIVIVNINVSEQLELDSPSIRPAFQVGYDTSFLQPFSANNGLAPYKFRLSPNGSVPPGMNFDKSDSTISGRPGRELVNNTVSIAYENNVDVIVEDQNCAEAQASYPQVTVWAPKLEGNPAPVLVDQSFSFTPVNTEGPIEQWELLTNVLPAWANFNSITGEISGVPGRSDVGISPPIEVRAVGPAIDAFQGIFGTANHTFTIEVTITEPDVITDIGDRTVAIGQNIVITPINTGGETDSWEIDNLPGWASFDTSTGVLSGIPTTIALHADIVIRAINVVGSSETEAFSINVVSNVIAPQLNGSPGNGMVDVSFGFTPGNSGGVASQWSLSGSLPAGLSFNSGIISGQPTSAGSFAGMSITASNSAGSSTLPITLIIDKGQQQSLLFASPGPIQKLTGDVAFTNVVSGGSGTGAISYQSSNSAVVMVDSVSGLVNIVDVGQASITANKAEDVNYLVTSASFTIQVSPATIIGGTPPTGYTGINYSWLPSVTGDTIVSWQMDSGSLPDGLSLIPGTGEITGVPTLVGEFSFRLLAVTINGDAYAGSFNITIELPRPAPNLHNNTNSSKCTFDLGFEGGCIIEMAVGDNFDHTYDPQTLEVDSWTTNGVLPAGMVFDDSNGRLSGTLSEGGNFIFSIYASNMFGSDFYDITFSIKQNQLPLVFENSGPVTISLAEGSFINEASGGSTPSLLTYSSSDENIATVDERTGEVSLLLPGSTTIKVNRNGDAQYFNISASYQLTVFLPAPEIVFGFSSLINEITTEPNGFSRLSAKIRLAPGSNTYRLFASTTQPVDPADISTLSSQTSIIDQLTIDIDAPVSRYFVAAQAISLNGVKSELSAVKIINTVTLESTLTGDAGTAFGNRMAMDGDVTVVRNTLNDAYAQTGSVSVYELVEGEWIRTQQLTGLQDWWGKSLDVHQAQNGSYRIATGTNASSNFSNTDRQGGLATYTKVIADICGNGVDDDGNGEIDESNCETVADGTIYNNGIWVVEQYLEGIYPEVIELNDNWMAIGRASADNCDSATLNCGEVAIHRFPESALWVITPDQIIQATPPQSLEFHFGYSVAAEQDVLVVGAPGASTVNCAGICGVFVYRDDGSLLNFEASMIPGMDPLSGKAYGHSVAISGNKIAVGDPSVPLAGGPNFNDGGDGAVYIFQIPEGELWNDGGSFTPLFPASETVNEEALNFGVSVSFSNNYLLVGDQKQNCLNDDTLCGIAHAFYETNGEYLVENTFSFMGFEPGAEDGFGFIIRADGNRLAVVKYLGESQFSPGEVLTFQLP